MDGVMAHASIPRREEFATRIALGARQRAEYGCQQDCEHQLEVFYNLHLTPWFQLTGDLQIIRPSRPAADTAIVPGARLRIWCADRLRAVKWRHYKLHFYQRVLGPVLKIVGAFEASLKQDPLIPMGTPDPYVPPGHRP